MFARFETRFLYLICGLVFGALVVIMTGCSTVDAFGGLMQGAGSDIRDAAQGTRNKMSERADR